MSYLGHLQGGGLPLCRGAVSIFYKPQPTGLTVKWFQVLQYNSHNLTSVIYLHTQFVGNFFLNELELIYLHTSTAQVNDSKYLLCITNISIKHQPFVYTQLNDQTVLFQTILLHTSHFLDEVYMSKSFIWPIDSTLSGATSSSQSGPGRNGSERVLLISLILGIPLQYKKEPTWIREQIKVR